jgi:hypothetical protein
MVTQETLSSLDMLYMTDYYDYIIDSFVNGQRKQGHELYNALSKSQRAELFDYFVTLYHYEALDNDIYLHDLSGSIDLRKPRHISELIQEYINTKL